MASTPTSPSAASVGPGGGAAAASGLGFQSQVGASFALSMLNEQPVDPMLGLGDARPVWIRFETEAPVDDILIATSAGGFIAVQAKTSLELSARPGGGLAKTVEQFVRHWLVCRDGYSSRMWDRPLDPNRDRLVLAVGPGAPRSVRLDLPASLKIRLQPGIAALSQEQARADSAFAQCVEFAWRNSTTEPWSPAFVDTLARLTSVWTFDATGADARWMDEAATRVAAPGQSRALLTALLHICDTWMAQRGGAELPALRRALHQQRVEMAAPPVYADDIGRLKAHSADTANALRRYEAIEHGADRIHVPRDCQGAVLAAAESGSLLIIGEPGSGKSAVINELARQLRSRGDVVELAVDRYSVETLDGLRVDLGLANELVKVLDAWDAPADGWLIIDALDATRGGKGEGAFRNLIERTLALKGRWKVIASIRSFDLRMGTRFRDLFPGRPPDPSYRDQAFTAVRHVRVPPWSEREFAQLLHQAPAIAGVLADAPRKLRELAEVPFNTRLISELLQDGSAAASLRDLSNQAGLLRLYWDRRVDDQGAPALACLHRIAGTMVDARALRAPMALAIQSDPGALDALCHQGVLVRVENDRYIQFRHHILFDYVASRLLLDVDAIVAGRSPFPKTATTGLMLAPALGYLLQELWASAPDRTPYWTAVEQVVGDHQGDPVLRSAASRLSAELPEVATDMLALARNVRSADAKAATVLGHVTAALAVRLEDESDVALAPWVALAGELQTIARRNAPVLRFLVHLLLSTAKPPQVTTETGSAARALLRVSFDEEKAEVGAASLIPFVVATYDTDAADSRALLETIFEPKRLAHHCWEDVPALCREIARLAEAAPDFAARIYGFTFAGRVDRDQVTRLGSSRILSLTSNAQQDYGSAFYSLNEFFPAFLRDHPSEAADAFAEAVDAYVARAHPPREGQEREIIAITVDARAIRLRVDLSHIWANDPDEQYAQDGEALIAKFTAAMQALPAHEARAVCDRLISKELSAVIWSRMFLAAVRRNDDLVDFLWPFAADPALLSLSDTRKDALDVVSAGYDRRGTAERATLERWALAIDGPARGDRLKKATFDHLSAAIGANLMVTAEARAHAPAAPSETRPTNKRPYRISTSWRPVGRFDWIGELDRATPENTAMIEAIEAGSSYFGLAPDRRETPDIEPAEGLRRLQLVAHRLEFADLHPDLRHTGEGVIGEGCVRLAGGRSLLAGEVGPDFAEPFLELLALASRSDAPTVGSETEARFEKSQSWSSPAPRVEAAEATLDGCLQRPDLYPRLAADIDRLLNDPHPAVRLRAIGNLIRIWDIDREGFWTRLSDRLELEANFGVLEGAWDLIRRTLHADHPSAAARLFQSLARFDATDDEPRAATMVADLVAILAISYADDSAIARFSAWIDDPIANKEPLHKIALALREAVGLGLRPGEGDQTDIRHRAQRLLHSIVMAANAHLADYDPNVAASDEKVEGLRACIELLDAAGMQLYFATGRTNGGEAGLTDGGCAVFLEETAPTIERIGDSAAPHTVYHIMQLLEILAPFGPAKAFELTAHAIGAGGKMGGYQNESLGADLMVRLIGTFLADHREIFESDSRRQALVACLETFMEAGWTAARRLLYRLPELIQ